MNAGIEVILDVIRYYQGGVDRLIRNQVDMNNTRIKTDAEIDNLQQKISELEVSKAILEGAKK